MCHGDREKGGLDRMRRMTLAVWKCRDVEGGDNPVKTLRG
jgi:hypothetical protein